MTLLGILGPTELFVICVIILPIIALVNLLKSNFKSGTDKIIWLIVILLIPILGSILYYILSPSQKVK